MGVSIYHGGQIIKAKNIPNEKIIRVDFFVGRPSGFGPDPYIIYTLNLKKKELANHVNDVLTDELQNQCTGGLMEQIWSLERRMHGIFL